MATHVRAVATLGPVMEAVRKRRVAETVKYVREACEAHVEEPTAKTTRDDEATRSSPSHETSASTKKPKDSGIPSDATFSYVERW